MAFETPKTGMSLEETQRYLYRLSEQLNLMYDGLESSLSKVDGNIGYGDKGASSMGYTVGSKDTEVFDFSELKTLILKTAGKVKEVSSNLKEDIDRIDVGMDSANGILIDLRDDVLELGSKVEVLKDITGSYVAESDFGEYKAEINNQLVQSVIDLTNYITSREEIITNNLDSYRQEVAGFIRQGIIYYDGNEPKIGIAIGTDLSTTTIDGQVVIEKRGYLTTLTSDKLSFWVNDVEVAYVSNDKLYIANAELLGELLQGNWKVSTTNGWTLEWRG